MTVFIKISELTVPQSGYLFIEGSKSGLLATPKFSSGTNKLSHPFRIICAEDDHLTFKFCSTQAQYQSNEQIGIGQLHLPLITRRYAKQLNLDDDFLLQVELIGESDRNNGMINCDITFDKVSYYEGEYAVGAVEIKKQKGIKKVQLYKGKCVTKNLFSMFDVGAEGQNYKFIESIYHDEGHEY